MTEKNQIYRCNVCGNIVSVFHTGAKSLVCCGEPMELLQAQHDDTLQEKHLPVVEKTDNGISVKIGSIPHPMEDEHFIEWIQIIAGDNVSFTYLKPGDEPQAQFTQEEGEILVRSYCNKHGLWETNFNA